MEMVPSWLNGVYAFYTKPRPKFVWGETSAADKMKAVNILDFLKALFICESTISSIIGVTFWYFYSLIHFLTNISHIIFRFAYEGEKIKGGQKMDEWKYQKVTYDQLCWKWSIYIWKVHSENLKYLLYSFHRQLKSIHCLKNTGVTKRLPWSRSSWRGVHFFFYFLLENSFISYFFL